MAKAAGDYDRMYKPANLKIFPYVRYRASVGSRNPRSEHGRYDGMIFHKDDPWLKTHWPPWDFGCNCELENLTEEEAQEDPGRIQQKTPPNLVTVDSKSGFSFDPAHAFEEYDLTRQTPISRTHILEEAAEAVKDGKLGNVGLITAPPTAGIPPAPLPNLNQVKQGFDAMKNEVWSKIQSVGLNPNNLPDYKTVNQAFKNAGKQGKNIESDILDLFPQKPFEVAKLNHRAAESSGLPDNVPIMLGRGNSHHGISHL